MRAQEFIKMNGAGNDFVVLDARTTPLALNFEQVRAIASRENPVTRGCDQVIMLEPSSSADCFMRIYNADGGEIDACGNATRCVAHLLAKEFGRAQVSVQTNVDILRGSEKDGVMQVDMGEPRLAWNEIPLAMKVDTLRVPMMEIEACCVSMGNPHAVFFMDALPSDAEVARIGRELEHNCDIFPEGVNVSFARIDGAEIQVKVWERGAGMTQACGTAACAVLVAAVRRGLITGRSAVLYFAGGALSVEWLENNHVLLGGKITTEFEGEVEI